MKIIRKDFRNLGKLLYCPRAIDPTILMALNSLAGLHIKQRIETAKKKSSISKIQHNILRRNNIIQKNLNDSPHLLRCILYIRTRHTNQSRKYIFLGPKTNTAIQDICPQIMYQCMYNAAS